MESLAANQVLNHLPHRPPFLFIDAVIEIVPNDYVVGIKQLDKDEYYFKGHFPSNPIMPGVLIIEALAQASCILFDISIPSLKTRNYYMGSVKFRFLNPAKPGEKLVLISKSVKMVSGGGVFEVVAKVGDKEIAKGEMAFICVAAS